MIQRIQTVYLTLAVILNTVVFFTPIYSHAVNDPVPWIGLGLAMSMTVALACAGIAIFLYKNRQTQLMWVKIGTYTQIVALGFAAGVLFSMGGFGTFLLREVLSTGIIVFVLMLFWLAGRGIKKDEELVRSMDRIR